MINALVFGKFLPFHKGHEAMIKFASTKCDKLTVLACCSDKENIPANIRKTWIEKTVEGYDNIDVQTFDFLESEFPNTSVASKSISKIWANKFKELFPDVNLIVTSEEYGDYVAEFMNVQHIPFNIQRDIVPVSATKIRNDLFTYWDFLPDAVKSYYAIKVVILGTESTGKSTLSKNLAQHFNASLVTEAGRDIVGDSKDFEYDDLYLVADEHSKRIEKAMCGDSPLIIIDTDIHITMSYGKFIFNKDIEVNKEIFNINKADLYLYLNNDTEFVQDGTRLEKPYRDLLDISHRTTLKENNIYIVEISGDWDTRFNTAHKHIENLIQIKNKII